LTPKTAQVGQHPNITLLSYSEVTEISGYVGSFKAKIKKKPRYVSLEKCTGCGICFDACPAYTVPKKRAIIMGNKIIKQVE